MNTELPFFCLSNSDLLRLLKDESCDNLIGIESTGEAFREYLYKLSKDPLLRSLNTAYYTTDDFIRMAKKGNKTVELRIFHLNIRSLNSKQREFCMLID